MKKTILAAVAGALLGLSSAASATTLSDAVDAGIRDCRSQDTLRVPARTSGADIVAFYANGYDTTTVPKSTFDKNDLDVDLYLQNDFAKQVEDYLSCRTPILRGTQGQINMAAPLTESDGRTEMVAIFQIAWSNGADAVVVRPHVSTPQDLSGAAIAITANGPHVDYMAQVLADAKEDASGWTDPSVTWTDGLIGFDGDTPGAVFLQDSDVDATFVARTDAQVLTSGGNVGTGAEGSVKGAEILMSTKSASRVISEVYVVRNDYYEANKDQIHAFVKAMFHAEEKLREDVIKQIVDWEEVAGFLLDDAGAEADAKQMWANIETTGLQGNIEWMSDSHPRSYMAINNDIQNVLVPMGLMPNAYTLATAEIDHPGICDSLFDCRRANLPGFDQTQAANAVSKMQAQGSLDDKTLFVFEINFKPNQNDFPIEAYREQFERVIDLAATYGGAVMTIEGHSDPLGYLKNKANGRPVKYLRQIRQAAKNLSVTRAQEVRSSVMTLASEQGVPMDPSQFVVSGLGFSNPKTGLCGDDPCPPKTEQEWLDNMRVVFRMVRMEAEASVFTPLNSW